MLTFIICELFFHKYLFIYQYKVNIVELTLKGGKRLF